MQIQIRKNLASKARPDFDDGSVFVGDRSYTHADGPFEVNDKKAGELIKAGLADAVVHMPRESAQRAVAPKLEAARR